jgi:hypothetical protein
MIHGFVMERWSPVDSCIGLSEELGIHRVPWIKLEDLLVRVLIVAN